MEDNEEEDIEPAIKANMGYIKALENGKENEKELNDRYMKQKIGSNVCFGDTIQLLHVKSQLYLVVSTNKTAEVERENLRVYLSDGNQSSWLQIDPRYKIDRDGDYVSNCSEVYLKLKERSSEYIRASDRCLPNSDTLRYVC